jgi:hypothetical protein
MGHHLVEHIEIDAFFGRKRSRFRHCEHLRGIDQLVAELHDLTHARSTHVHDERRKGLEGRPNRGEYVARSTDHDRQRALLGADRSARQRCVEVGGSGGVHPRVLGALHLGIDRRRVDDDLARPQSRRRRVEHRHHVG